MLILAGVNVAVAAGRLEIRSEAEAPLPSRTAVVPEELDRSIERTLAKPDYTWRTPRETMKSAELEEGGFLDSLGHWLEEQNRRMENTLRRFVRWLRKLFKKPDPALPEPADTAWQDTLRVAYFALLAAAAVLLALVLFRLRRRRLNVATAVAVTATAPVDVADETTQADRLPSDEWMTLARELMQKGEFRLAMRALFLGTLAHLAQRERLTIARHKSNRDYRLELDRKAHDQPAVLEAFGENVAILERVWYGTQPATEDLVRSFERNGERIGRS